MEDKWIRRPGFAWMMARSLALLVVSLDAKYLTQDGGQNTNYRKLGCAVLDGNGFSPDAGNNKQYTINMADQTRCNGRRCPHCFIFQGFYNGLTLRLQNCEQTYPTGSFDYATGIMPQYEFFNIEAFFATITDDVNTYHLPGIGKSGSSMSCFCNSYSKPAGASLLICDQDGSPARDLNTYPNTHGATCATISADQMLDLGANPSCAFRFCPYCYRLDTTNNAVELKLKRCSTYEGLDMGTDGILKFEFVNTGPNLATVTDDIRTYWLNKYTDGRGYMTCVCFNSLLHCDNPTWQLNNLIGSDVNAPYRLLTNNPNMNGYAVFPQDVRVGGVLTFTDAQAPTTYMRFDSGASPSPGIFEWRVAGDRGLAVYGSGGKLHGTWTADVAVTTSDARMKTDIKPLQDALSLLQASSSAADAASASPAQWIISQLRPVSYRYLKAGGQRFGFIADEVQKVLPSMVLEDKEDADRTKKLLLTDFISLLVAAVQGQQQTLDVISNRGDERHNTIDHRLSALEQELQLLRMEVSELRTQTANCKSWWKWSC